MSQTAAAVNDYQAFLREEGERLLLESVSIAAPGADFNQTVTVSAYAVLGWIAAYSSREIDGERIIAGDQRCWVSWSSASPPVPGWRIVRRRRPELKKTASTISALASGNLLRLASGTWPAFAVGDLVSVVGLETNAAAFAATVASNAGTDLGLSGVTLVNESAGPSVTVALAEPRRLLVVTANEGPSGVGSGILELQLRREPA